MNEENAKRILVDALLASMRMSKKIKDPEDGNDVYLTYVTANGFIVGKELDYEILDIDTEKDFEESFRETLMDKKNVSIFSIVDTFAKNYASHLKEDTVIKNRKNYKILEDVTIISNNGNSPIKSNMFVLFLDQVIGIVPGKVSQ
ncbi:hypothetical protein A9490_27990 [Bacillus thuringiensis]|uniref:hypothetical protein n=1 Tax=Bacillus thuringiensis TaxID=1428 RepID=UPI0008FE4C8D|nr:hypothetical protein [Bacillus thuringiensis]OJE28362.1 hypothetical protein A9490_27990 [Bacillus thuringiensis]